MNKLTIFALAAVVAGTALAQSFWIAGPSQVSAINGWLDGSIKEVSYADGVSATLHNATDDNTDMLGIDATFQPAMTRTRSFVITLTALAKSDSPTFSHFEAFDFTSKEWIEVAGATSPRAARPVAGGPMMLLSQSLETSRFAEPTTGEVWARAMWNSAAWNSKGEKTVYLDQFALMYYK